MGQPLTASPVTYMTGGRQYVAIAAQTDVFVYGLHEPAKAVPVLPGLEEVPTKK
jgi:hypothetical protein